MLHFEIQGFLDEVRKAVVDEELGVEKFSEFYLYDSLAEQYWVAATLAIGVALRERLGLAKLCEFKPETPEAGTELPELVVVAAEQGKATGK